MSQTRWAVRRDSFNPIPLNRVTVARLGIDLFEIAESEIPVYHEKYLQAQSKLKINSVEEKAIDTSISQTVSSVPLIEIEGEAVEIGKTADKKESRSMTLNEIREELARDFGVFGDDRKENEHGGTYRLRLKKILDHCRDTGFPPEKLTEVTIDLKES